LFILNKSNLLSRYSIAQKRHKNKAHEDALRNNELETQNNGASALEGNEKRADSCRDTQRCVLFSSAPKC
jgi:hypothetical protein